MQSNLLRLREFFAILLAVLAVFGSSAFAAPAVRVTGLRIGGDAQTTRVVIDADSQLSWNAFTLAGGEQRVVIDLPLVRWSINGLTAESGSGKGAGLVAGFRYAHSSPTTSRLVLDLAKPALVRSDFSVAPRKSGDGQRIVLDLKAVPAKEFERATQESLSAANSSKPKRVRKPLVVIDAGHGGKDPGAHSASGVEEKDITLAAALALRDALLATGRFDVALTRETDVFIELDARVTRARELGADLFLALHADAGGDPSVRGASVYTLSREGEKRADLVRQRNDWVMDVETDRSRPAGVNQILVDLVQRDTKNQSARFAEALVPALTEAGWPALPNSHRQRGFYVLLAPDVPAVLLEMGFLTNVQDEAMLTSQRKRAKLVEGITQAIDRFFLNETQKPGK